MPAVSVPTITTSSSLSLFFPDELSRPRSLTALLANQRIPPKLAGDKDTWDVGFSGSEWRLRDRSTRLRPEHRLDRFDGARRLMDTWPMPWSGSTRTAVLFMNPIACSGQVLTQTFSDTLVGVNGQMARQGLYDSRLDRLGQASAGFLLAVATVL